MQRLAVRVLGSKEKATGSQLANGKFKQLTVFLFLLFIFYSVFIGIWFMKVGMGGSSYRSFPHSQSR